MKLIICLCVIPYGQSEPNLPSLLMFTSIFSKSEEALLASLVSESYLFTHSKDGDKQRNVDWTFALVSVPPVNRFL